jgi:hypothetical protein
MPINPKLVHVYRLTEQLEGRDKGAWVFQYRGESFVTDPEGTTRSRWRGAISRTR